MNFKYRIFVMSIIVLLIAIVVIPTFSAQAMISRPPQYTYTHNLRTDVEKTITLWNGVQITFAQGDVPEGSTLWSKRIPHMGPVNGQYPATTVYRFGIYDPDGKLIKRPWGRICIPISDDLLAMVVAKHHYIHFVYSMDPMGGEDWKDATMPQYDATWQMMCGWNYVNPSTYFTLIEK